MIVSVSTCKLWRDIGSLLPFSVASTMPRIVQMPFANLPGFCCIWALLSLLRWMNCLHCTSVLLTCYLHQNFICMFQVELEKAEHSLTSVPSSEGTSVISMLAMLQKAQIHYALGQVMLVHITFYGPASQFNSGVDSCPLYCICILAHRSTDLSLFLSLRWSVVCAAWWRW